MLPADIHRRLEAPPVRPVAVDWAYLTHTMEDVFAARWPDGSVTKITQEQYAQWADPRDAARSYAKGWRL